MIETYFSKMIAMFSSIPFSGATWFVLFVLGFFVWLFTKASRDPSSVVKWEHLIVDSENDRTSPYKVGYLVGVIVSTWIVITYADTKTLSFDIFGTYLTFLLGGAGVNSFTKSKTPPAPVNADDAIPGK